MTGRRLVFDRPGRRAAALGTVISLAIAWASLPSPAAAADAPVLPQVTAFGPRADDPGLLEVHASSDAPIDTLTATVSRQASTVTEIGDFTLVSGTTQDGVWRSSRLVLPLYASYDLALDVVDRDGDHLAVPSTSMTAYLPVTSFAGVVQTPTSLNYVNRDLHAVGSLRQLDPRTGDVTALAGRRVELRTTAGSSEASTLSDGSFSVTHTPSLTALDTTLHLGSVLVADAVTLDLGGVDAVPTPTRVLLDSPELAIKEGVRFVVSGTAEVLDGGAWVPLVGQRIDLGGGRSADLRTTTRAGGRFAFSTVSGCEDPSGLPVFQLGVGLPTRGIDVNPWLSGEPAVQSFRCSRRMRLDWLSPGITPDSEIHVEATLTQFDHRSPPKGTRVYLQKASTSTGPWRTFRYLVTDTHGAVRGNAYTTRPDGYWRLSYLGDSLRQPIATKAYHLSRHATRIASFNASPEPIRSGGSLRVSGRLQRQLGTWSAYGGQRVGIYFRSSRTSRYTYVGSATTTSTGAFQRQVTARHDGYWTAVWLSTSRYYLNAYGSQDYVRVR